MKKLQQIMALVLVACICTSLTAWSPFEQVPAQGQGVGYSRPLMIGAVGAAVVAAGALAVYVKSNDSLVGQIAELHATCETRSNECLATIKNIEDLPLFATRSGAFKRDMIVARSAFDDMTCYLQGRYGLWVTPWNWMREMRDAVKKTNDFSKQIDFLLTVLKYAPCLRSDMTSDELIKASRVMCDGDSMYPVLEVVEGLRADIYYLKNLDVDISCYDVYIEALEMIRSTLIASDRYAGELEAREQEKQCQQGEKASQERTRIQREHALALTRQAAAIEERNKLERRKNK